MASTADLKSESLTARQRRLVADNLGLVAVHLRRNVPNLSLPRRDREWDDLFQEGVVGLIQAAIRFRAASGIPFASFAFPRIHNAVSAALRRKFSLIAGPVGPSPDDDPNPERAPAQGRHAPRVIHLQTDPPARSPHDRHALCDEPARETVGERLKGKYDHAVHKVAGSLRQVRGTRADRARLVERLAQERLLVPEPESRTALRQIARDTGSSYSRVAQCDKQFSGLVRDLLRHDPELDELRTQARRSSDGGGVVIDNELEQRLSGINADRFLACFRRADRAGRAWMLYRLFEAAEGGPDWQCLIRNAFCRLRPAQREELVWDVVAGGADRALHPSVAADEAETNPF